MIRQLLPVLDLLMYTSIISHNTISNDDIAVYKQICEVYKFEIIQRQFEDSEEQQEFRDVLLRMREGESSINNWKILSTRFEEKLNRTERDGFSEATSLLTT